MKILKSVFAGLLLVCCLATGNAYANETRANSQNVKICYGQGRETDENNRPIGALDAQERYCGLSAFFIGEKEDKTIYLTFDEGYENGYTGDILDTLKEKGVSATFYVTMDYVKKNPELIKRMIDEGHEIGNHTTTHPSLPDLSDDEFFEEINKLEQYISHSYGYTTTTLRPPMGEFSERTLELAENMGYKTVLWSFAYNDWNVDNQPGQQAAYERITKATHNGAVYLLHAVSKTNAAILGDVIDFWKSRGYAVKLVK